MQQQGLFKGFNQVELLTMEPRLMCAILSEQLAKAGIAIEALSVEVKALRDVKAQKDAE